MGTNNRSRSSWRPSPAMAVAVAALFASLTGTALALQANTVRSEHIVNGQVRSADVANDGLRGVDIADDGVTGAEVVESSLGKVGDSNTLDGIDSSGFLQGGSLAGGDVKGTFSSLQLNLGAVKSAEVADDSLTGADVNEASLAGVVGLETVVASTPANNSDLKTALATCPAGKRVVGTGGNAWSNEHYPPVAALAQVLPSGEKSVRAVGTALDPPSQLPWAVSAYAICAKAP